MRKHVVDLLKGRPGWRLEARSTPGASPLWCYVVDGDVLYSVTAEPNKIRLYVMATDQEIVFDDAGSLAEWLRTHRPDALRDQGSEPGAKAKGRLRQTFRWE